MMPWVEEHLEGRPPSLLRYHYNSLFPPPCQPCDLQISLLMHIAKEPPATLSPVIEG